MSPVFKDLKRAEKKLDQLNNLRVSGGSPADETTSGNNKSLRSYIPIIDAEIEKAYDEYALLKIRYLMDIL